MRNRLLVPHNFGLDVYDFSAETGDLTPGGTIDMNTTFDDVPDTLNTIPSVAVDPLNRGFAVALADPTSRSNAGRLLFISLATNAVEMTLNVGFQPHMVTFTPDGSKVLVANEGERSDSLDIDPPGSLTVVNLSGITADNLLSALGMLSQSNVATYDLSDINLALNVSLEGVRVRDRNFTAEDRHLDMEPEYIAASNEMAWVVLQNNNAIGRFVFSSAMWEAVFSLGPMTCTVDASDRDGTGGSQAIQIDDLLSGLPMPDAIQMHMFNNIPYIFTANEGAFGDDNSRFVAVVEENRLDPDVLASLNEVYNSRQGVIATDDSALGRTFISILDGDIDDDGLIEEPTIFGTRSFAIFNGMTGELVFDSASDFETITAELAPDLFNSRGSIASGFDLQSDTFGPQPEGLQLATIGGTLYAFVSSEPGGVIAYKVEDPAEPEYVTYHNSAADSSLAFGGRGPRDLQYKQIDGRHLLFVPCDFSDTIEVLEIEGEIQNTRESQNTGEPQNTDEPQITLGPDNGALNSRGSLNPCAALLLVVVASSFARF